MAAAKLPVYTADGQLAGYLQTFRNTIGGDAVDAEAVTLTDASGAPVAVATEAGQGTDGATPPAIAGTGVRGWLRAIYENAVTVLAKLNAGLTPTGLAAVDANNSSSANLVANATFTGAGWIDTLEWPMVTVAAFSDVASATNGLVVQYSDTNGGTVRDTDVYTLAANDGQTLKFGPGWRYARVFYTNGATPTGTFLIQTILRKVTQKSSTHRIADRVNGQQDADLIEAVCKGAGTYTLIAGAGPSANVAVPDGAWIIGVGATSPASGGATITGIPGMTGTVTLPGSSQKTTAKNLNPPLGTCIGVAATPIAFAGVDSYEVEYLVV